MNDDTTTITQLKQLMDDFVAEREWQPFHNPKNLSASIAIEAAELMEHFQWLRTDQLDSVRDNPNLMEAIAEELSDVIAYALSFASTMDIDIASSLKAKMKKNALKYPADQFRGKSR